MMMSRFEDPPPISEGQLELELDADRAELVERSVLVRLSDVEGRPAPWAHYPHCPGCHRRIVSENPAATFRAIGRWVYPSTWAGSACPWCSAELERTDTST